LLGGFLDKKATNTTTPCSFTERLVDGISMDASVWKVGDPERKSRLSKARGARRIENGIELLTYAFRGE